MSEDPEDDWNIWILNWPERSFSLGWVSLAVIVSLGLRLSLFDFESSDFRNYLSPWYDFFVKHGRWHGLSELTVSFFSYPPLYSYMISLSTWLPLKKLYAIKLTSIICDYLAAYWVWRLTRKRRPSRRIASMGAVAFLFLPTVVMNGALWAQCDIMFTTGLLASLFYILERKPLSAMIAFGVSISLKPQAIFWCPLLAGLFLRRRLPWKWIWVPPIVYCLSCIPAILAGRRPIEALGHWVLVRNAPGLVHGAPNWYQFLSGQVSSAVLSWVGIGLAIICTALFIFLIKTWQNDSIDDSRIVVSLALLSVLFPPFLLPGMHNRYFFAADVLSLVYAIYVPFGWCASLLIQCASVLAYFPFLFKQELVPVAYCPTLILVSICFVLNDLFAQRHSLTELRQARS